MHFNSGTQSRSAWTEQVGYGICSISEHSQWSRLVLPKCQQEACHRVVPCNCASGACKGVCLMQMANVGTRVSSTIFARFATQEDEYLRAAVRKYGDRAWAAVAQEVPGRSSKSCSDRCDMAHFTQWSVASAVGGRSGSWHAWAGRGTSMGAEPTTQPSLWALGRHGQGIANCTRHTSVQLDL